MVGRRRKFRKLNPLKQPKTTLPEVSEQLALYLIGKKKSAKILVGKNKKSAKKLVT